jgi:hypothetical protein
MCGVVEELGGFNGVIVKGCYECMSDAVDKTLKRGLFVAGGVCSNEPVQGGRSLAMTYAGRC